MMEAGGGGGYRLEAMICALVLSADDELNNGEELKGLLATANLWPLSWGKEVEKDREKETVVCGWVAARQLWAVRAADLL